MKQEIWWNIEKCYKLIDYDKRLIKNSGLKQESVILVRQRNCVKIQCTADQFHYMLAVANKKLMKQNQDECKYIALKAAGNSSRRWFTTSRDAIRGSCVN